MSFEPKNSAIATTPPLDAYGETAPIEAASPERMTPAQILEAVACMPPSTEVDDVGPVVQLAFATKLDSNAYRNVAFPTFEAAARVIGGIIADEFPKGLRIKHKQDSFVHTGGPLSGGDTCAGARRIQANVAGFNTLFLDYDKGHATVHQVIDRCRDLGLFAAAYPSFSDGATSHKVPWETVKTNRKSGLVETVPGAFQTYCNGAPASDALARRFATEVEGYHPNALGEVRLGDSQVVESCTTRTKFIVLHHGPITKVRLMIAIELFVRSEGETLEDFKERWFQFYHAVAGMVGITHDRSCASIERAFFGITRNAKAIGPALVLMTRGHVLGHDDPRVQEAISAEQSVPTPRPQRALSSRAKDLPALADNATPLQLAMRVKERAALAAEREALRDKWRGFKAADAAADLWSDVTDKRKDRDLVAMECPFIDEHTTSNKPGTRQLAIYNASTPRSLPTCKCHSDTCQGRPFEDFCEALFPDELRLQPRYRKNV